MPRENIWFYQHTETAFADLQRHADEIDYLVPFWFGITKAGTLVDMTVPEVIELAGERNLPILAIIHNFASPEYEELIHQVLTTPESRENLVESIYQMLEQRGFAGINIDFEFIPPEDREALNIFMEMLYNRLSPQYLLTISVPAKLEENPQHPFSGAFDYSELARFSDQLFILAYDEHFAVPGPIASIDFVRTVIAFALTEVPREKIKLGMPVYGYDWELDDTELPESLTYFQAVSRAREHGANIIYDLEAQAPTYTYFENSTEHIVWFENARSFAAKLGLVIEYDLAGIAVWRLGQEDQRVWYIINAVLRRS